MTALLRVLGWVLAVVSLGLLLVAPNANGPLLVLVWSLAVAAFRYLTSIIAGRTPRFVLGAAFLWGCFLGAFWGGWFLIPAGVAFLVADWRSEARGVDPRLLTVEVLAAVAAAVSGLLALALLVAAQPGASIRGPANVAPDGTPIYENLADIAASGPPTDRLDLAVVIAAVLCGVLVLAAATHARTSRRLAFLAMCASVVGLATFAGLASLSAGWWFIPAVALGVAACLAAWRRRRRASGRLGTGRSGAPEHGLSV